MRANRSADVHSRFIVGRQRRNHGVVGRIEVFGDRLEGDEELSYEGQALSPVLQPVFRSEDPIDLQLYFVLYPDVNGPPLELSVVTQAMGRGVTQEISKR